MIDWIRRFRFKMIAIPTEFLLDRKTYKRVSCSNILWKNKMIIKYHSIYTKIEMPMSYSDRKYKIWEFHTISYFITQVHVFTRKLLLTKRFSANIYVINTLFKFHLIIYVRNSYSHLFADVKSHYATWSFIVLQIYIMV